MMRRGRAAGLWVWLAAFALPAALALLRREGPDAPLAGLEDRLIDRRVKVRGPEAPPPEAVAVVLIDDETLAATGLYAPMRRCSPRRSAGSTRRRRRR